MVEAQAQERLPQWTLADRLRKSLEHASVDSVAMAEYLEVHPNTVRNWLAGRTTPPATAVKLWAMRCGVPYEWIAHGIVSRSDPQRPHCGTERPGYAPVYNEVTALAKPIGSSDDELAARLASGIPVSSVLGSGQVVNS